MMILNNKKIQNIHFVGIKGIAMTTLAVYCTERGFNVTGSDLDEIYPSDEILQKNHLHVLQGFSAKHINKTQPDLVIYTGAHNGRLNIEVQEALKQRISVFSHGQALGLFMKNSLQVSVAGCHGKTTTSSMVAAILTEAKLDPSFVIGCGNVKGLGTPGHYGKSKVFIAEADEYVSDPQADLTPRFLWQNPDILCITNVDYDHPDVYSSLDEIKAVYQSIYDKVPKNGSVIINSDDLNSRYLNSGKKNCISVGTSVKSEYLISNLSVTKQHSGFLLTHGNTNLKIILTVPGAHNIQNAAMAAAVARQLNVSWNDIQKGLKRFGGAKRRFEFLEDKDGVKYFDDYAHHPKEIQATLLAMRGKYSKNRIIVVFQPHTYSRTKALLADFATSFHQADIIIITSIYASAREKDTLGISDNTLMLEVAKNEKNVFFANGPDEILRQLKLITKKGDIVLFMGAGSIYSWETKIIHYMN